MVTHPVNPMGTFRFTYENGIPSDVVYMYKVYCCTDNIPAEEDFVMEAAAPAVVAACPDALAGSAVVLFQLPAVPAPTVPALNALPLVVPAPTVPVRRRTRCFP